MTPLPYVEAACPIGHGQRNGAGVLDIDRVSRMSGRGGKLTVRSRGHTPSRYTIVGPSGSSFLRFGSKARPAADV